MWFLNFFFNIYWNLGATYNQNEQPLPTAIMDRNLVLGALLHFTLVPPNELFFVSTSILFTPLIIQQ